MSVSLPSRQLGILSGISYVSGLDYFQKINEKTIHELPKGFVMTPNPSIMMISIDCDKYAHFLMNGLFDDVAEHILVGVRRLVCAGCDLLVIASNTGHIAFPVIQREFPMLEIIHIADCCAHKIRSYGITTVGLLGTKMTMEETYLKSRLTLHGISTIVPSEQESRDAIFKIIVEELSYNKFIDTSRATMIAEIEAMRDRGAKACILGCTEIELLLDKIVIDGIILIHSAEVHTDAIAAVLTGRTELYELLPPDNKL
jgi:aspartate racemase